MTGKGGAVQSNEPGPARQLSDALVTGPVAPATLFILWLALLWAGTQVPQAWAPLGHPDGGSRADLLAMAGLGLHHLAGSLPTWLLAASTLVVAAARLLHRPAESPATERLSSLEARLGKVVGGATWRRSSGGRALRFGPVVAFRALLAIAAVLVLTGWLVHGHGVAPTILQTDAAGSVTALAVDAGRRVATASVSGRCSQQQGTLECTLAGATPGLADVQGQVVVAPGRPATIGAQTVTLLAHRPLHTVDRGRLRWRRGGPGATDAAASDQNQDAKATWYAFELPAGKSVTVPSLGAQVSLVDGRRAGPLVVASASGKVSVAAAAGVVVGAPTMRLEAARAARVVVGQDHARWFWAGAGVLLLLAFAIFLTSPIAEVRVSAGGAHLGVHSPRVASASIARAIALWQEEA